MTVRLTRATHGGPPQSQGLEIDDAGHASSWQTSGNRVGRFARDLSADERASLERALASARNADVQSPDDGADQPTPPSGTTEQLTADGLSDVVLAGNTAPPDGAEELFELLRDLREDLADSPVAAIELQVDGSPPGARVRHIGHEPVAVRANTVNVNVTSFGPDSAIVGTATHIVEDTAVDGPVAAGWELRLVDDLGVSFPPAGGFLTVTVGTLEVDSIGDGVLRRTELSWMTE